MLETTERPQRRLYPAESVQEMLQWNRAVVLKLGALAAIVAFIGGLLATIGALATWPAIALQFAAGLFIYGASVAALLVGEDGTKLSLSECLTVARSRYFDDLFLCNLRAFFIVLGLTITVVGIPWAIKRFVKWFPQNFAIIADGQMSYDALDYCAALIAGSWWQAFWRLILIVLVAGLPATVVTGLLYAIQPGQIVSLLLHVPATWFGYVYAVCATGVYYNELKRKAALHSAFERRV